MSHASADLPNVRKVRNYLEANGAAPLLFHLRSLVKAEQFWPVIEGEIVERSFFLYCDSDAAQASEWVAKERNAIAAAARKHPKRIATINVEGDIDFKVLDDFLATARVYPIYAHSDAARVERYLSCLRAVGFQVCDVPTRTDDRIAQRDLLAQQMQLAAKDGWVLVFLSAATAVEEVLHAEIAVASHLQAAIVPVLIRPVLWQAFDDSIRMLHMFNGLDQPRTAPLRLAQHLLQRMR